MLARIWAFVIQLFLTPVIVRLLGPENYGLVAFGVTMSLFLLFLDQAVSPVLARELARSTVATTNDAKDNTAALTLLRTLEVVSIAMALVIGGLVVLTAPLIARYGLASGGPAEEKITTAVRLIGLGLAAQWPSMLYSSGFIGLQRQDVLTTIRLISSTAQAVGAIAILLTVSASVEMYLSFAACATAIASAAMRVRLWRLLTPPGGARSKPRFDGARLRTLWRFAAGSLLIGFTSALLTQVPTLIVAKFCTLSQLAAFTLSAGLASQISVLTQPVISSLGPHLTQIAGGGDQKLLADEYHRWTQIIVALVLPAAGTLMAFAHPLIELWLGSRSPLVMPVVTILPWIVLGTVLNTLVTPPYLLQVAHGWTRLSAASNLIAVAIILPALLLLVPRYGPMAAAGCWIAVNLGYYLFQVPVMHKLLLPSELLRWWLADTLLPAAAVAVVYAVAWLAVPRVLSPMYSLPIVGAAVLCAFAVLISALPLARRDLKRGSRLLCW